MAQKGITDKVIYSDSVNAQLWVNKKQCKTKLERTPQTEQLYQVIARAENWLRTHPITVPIFNGKRRNGARFQPISEERDKKDIFMCLSRNNARKSLQFQIFCLILQLLSY